MSCPSNGPNSNKNNQPAQQHYPSLFMFMYNLFLSYAFWSLLLINKDGRGKGVYFFIPQGVHGRAFPKKGHLGELIFHSILYVETEQMESLTKLNSQNLPLPYLI
jgi:hypothetical protein